MTLIHAIIQSSGLQKKSIMYHYVFQVNRESRIIGTHIVNFTTEHLIIQTVNFKYETKQ